MNKLDRLLEVYRNWVSLPWQTHLPTQQRVWFVVYEPRLERQLIPKIDGFKSATIEAGHGWSELDLTHTYGNWLGKLKYRDSYLCKPELLSKTANSLLPNEVAATLCATLAQQSHNDVLALHGLVGLFGALRVSDLIERTHGEIRGRLLVFFPGSHEQDHYRFLNARDGWNYHAAALKIEDSETQ